MKRQSKGTLIQVVLSDADIAELDLICDEIAAKRTGAIRYLIRNHKKKHRIILDPIKILTGK
jgi:hypothetical protein